MKKGILSLLASLLLFASCKNFIKNKNASVEVEEGTKVDTTSTENQNLIIGNYVGIFEPDFENDLSDSIKWAKSIHASEAFYWNRENKISIAFESFNEGKVIGYSVVAGNERSFVGEFCSTDSGFHFTVKEPGDNKHDGTFSFFIKDTVLKGKWKAFAKIDIQNRKYNLVKREFAYNANIMLDSNDNDNSTNKFIDWTKPEMSIEEIKTMKSKMTKNQQDEYEEFEENTNFASATKAIYKINTSTTLLTEKEVANMKRGDLNILRNMIYARHGYSFKYRPLRVFFDKQSWYVPFSTNIKTELTETEKQNIQLLLKYEKNAKEYYDYFGRG